MAEGENKASHKCPAEDAECRKAVVVLGTSTSTPAAKAGRCRRAFVASSWWRMTNAKTQRGRRDDVTMWTSMVARARDGGVERRATDRV